MPIDLDAARQALEAMLPALDVPIEGLSQESAVCVALGLRATELYWAVLAGAEEFPNATQVVLRSLIEAAITIRWIEGSPAVRVRLWLAEDSRNQLSGQQSTQEWFRRRGRTEPEMYDPPTRAAMRREIEAARRSGLAAHEALRKDGTVLPPIESMAKGSSELWEAYHIAYRTLSPWVHGGGRSMVFDSFEARPDGTHLRPGRTWMTRQTVSLAMTAMLIVIESISRQARIGLDDGARRIRDDLTAWEPEHASTEAPVSATQEGQ